MSWMIEFKRTPQHYKALFNALVTPVTQFDANARSFDGGVYDSGGQLYSPSLHVKNGFHHAPPITVNNVAPSQVLQGKYLYAGLLQNEHFGHFLVESLGRLWASQMVTNAKGVLFLLRSGDKPVARFVGEVLQRLLGNLEIHYVRMTTQVETLVVPTATVHPVTGYVLGHRVNTALFRRLHHYDANAPKKIYVSRSQLSSNEGRYLAEDYIETQLQRQGYAIVHPQTLSIEEQLRLYSNADKLIFADGSAFHLYTLVARPEQQVFVVWRRKMHHDYTHQLLSFANKKPIGTPCLLGCYRETGRPTLSVVQLAVLNIPALHQQLVDAGFISPAHWQQPPQHIIEEEVAAFSRRFKRDYFFVSTDGNAEPIALLGPT